MDCPVYAHQRAGLINHVRSILSSSSSKLSVSDFDGLSGHGQCEVLLGKRIGDPTAENRIDKVVKKYLIKAWNIRSKLTSHINTVLNVSYSVCSLDAKDS